MGEKRTRTPATMLIPAEKPFTNPLCLCTLIFKIKLRDHRKTRPRVQQKISNVVLMGETFEETPFHGRLSPSIRF